MRRLRCGAVVVDARRAVSRGVLLTRLDVFPALCAVLALLATRLWLVGAFAGPSAGLKPWPAATIAVVD